MTSSGKNHERYDIPNSDILFEDVWAEDAAATDTCPACGTTLSGTVAACPKCGERVDVCTGSCSSCGARVCVEGKPPSERG